MSTKKGNHDLALEVTVLSAQSLKNPSSPLLPGRRLRPYVILSVSAAAANQDNGHEILYRTRVDENGGQNPSWGDTIRLPLSPSFLQAAAAAVTAKEDDEAASGVVHVSVLSSRLFGEPAKLGWCRITASDVLDGLRPPAMQRRLSYALRCAGHGGRGHGVIHVAARLLGTHLDRLARDSMPPARAAAEPAGWCRVAIGIPVAAPPVFRRPPERSYGVGHNQSGTGFKEGHLVGVDFGWKSHEDNYCGAAC